jgi:hypothetical protein
MAGRKAIRSIIAIEVIGFMLIAMLLWLDEILDFPHVLFGAPVTPINWVESLMESTMVLALGAIVIFFSFRLARHIGKLERLFPICVVCEKICMPGKDQSRQESWSAMDLFAIDHAGAGFTNALCPKCKAKCGTTDPGKKSA